MTRALERALVAALALLAAGRVFACASAFPFFHNIDEHRHVDVVFKYARGYLPEGGTPPLLEPYVATLVSRFGSPEYQSPAQAAAAIPPPGDPRLAAPAQRARVRTLEQMYARFVSMDADSPPGYYAVASVWLRLGWALGLQSTDLLYFVRWLNALALAALVAGAWVALRRTYPEEALLRLGPPAVIALFPNDVLYGVSSDALLPLWGGLAFFALARLVEAPPPRARLAAGAGAAVALAVLTKYTAAPLLVLVAIAGAALLRQARAASFRSPALSALGWLAVSLLLPIAFWGVRNWLVLGDPLGMEIKAARMQIENRPLAEWPDHPLFTLRGWAQFLGTLFESFWRGEFFWHGQLLAYPWMDAIYLGASLGTLALAPLALLRGDIPSQARRLEGLGALFVFGSIGVQALLSVGQIVHTGAAYRWEDFPFYGAGRYLGAALAPFAVLLVRALDTVCLPLGRARRVAAGAILLGFLALVAVTEVALTSPVFASSWNWYHLP